MTEKTFMRITNHQIYAKIEELCDHVAKTNGKVKLNRWIATTSLTLVTLVLGFLLSHVL